MRQKLIMSIRFGELTGDSPMMVKKKLAAPFTDTVTLIIVTDIKKR